LKIERSNAKKLSPGYYFITPYWEARSPGPYIFDNEGVRLLHISPRHWPTKEEKKRKAKKKEN
jgi:hypothetical protein